MAIRKEVVKYDLWLVGLFLLLPLGAYGIRETLRFTLVS
jgi:hypothetical protein